MQRQFTFQNSSPGNPFGSILNLILLVLFLVGLFFLASFIFKILSWASPFLLIATLLIDHRVVVNYGKFLVNLFQRSPVSGVIVGLLTLFGFPLVAAFLFGKAILKKKIEKRAEEFQTRFRQEQENFTPFEEVSPEPEERVELPKVELPKQPVEAQKNKYDDFFEERK